MGHPSQHLDDMCGAASADSDALHRLDQAFMDLANFLGVKLAPRDMHFEFFNYGCIGRGDS